MRILQVLPTIAYGDAVSNDTIALKKIIRSMGYKTAIYARSITPPLDKRTALPIETMPKLQPDDIVIYHLSTGNPLNYEFAEFPCRKMIVYHNITPPEFFDQDDTYIAQINREGLEAAQFLKDKVEYCLADSEFNRQDLLRMGYKCPIDVLPILIPLDDYKKKPDSHMMRMFKDSDCTTFVFTGRVVPNKKHEDLIAAFYYYKKLFNENSRLVFVGNFKPSDLYYIRLKGYASYLGLSSVLFTGHVKFNQILAYYKQADAFLCASEHEGFCVPLVEAMSFDVPILAYDSCAVGDTLGGSGFLVPDKDPIFLAYCMNRMVTDKALRQSLIAGQRRRLQDFSYDRIAEQFRTYLQQFIDRPQQ